MLQSTTLKFLSDLKKNNNKAWFETNRNRYEEAKADYSLLVESIIAAIVRFDALVGGLKAKDCMFRINRDVRFSKDKSPYKTNMGAYFNAAGKKANTPGYYFHLEPAQSFAAGGLWMPEPADLAKLRQEIDYNAGAWKKIVKSPSFKKYFTEGLDNSSMLSRPPKGYTEDNPALEYLKLKSYVVRYPVSDAMLCKKTLAKDIAAVFERMKPMLDFLKQAVE